MSRLTLSVLLSLLLAGCTLLPKPLQFDDEAALTPFTDAIQDLEFYLNKPVRWGGVIASVENKPDETVLELVEYPLNSMAKPIVKQRGSRGRFRLHIPGFLEPSDYPVGRRLTVLGRLNGAEQGSIGEYTYLFASVEAENFHLWREEKPKQETVILYHQPLIYDYWYRPRWIKFQHP